jgi:hypothetical protein
LLNCSYTAHLFALLETASPPPQHATAPSPSTAAHTRQIGAANSNGNFPFELQVSQLLQENIIIISSMRTNLLSVKVADNLPLMEKFYKNMQSIFSMLSALPCAMPPLPSQYRINDAFIRYLSTGADASQTSAPTQIPSTSAAATAALPSSTGPAAVLSNTSGGRTGNFTHGQQAGMAFPNHPSSIRAIEAGESMLAGPASTSGGRMSEDDTTALRIAMAPPTVQTGRLGDGQRSNILDGVGGVLGASPANALQALPLGQPAPPPGN